MFIRVQTVAVLGLQCLPVVVEADVSGSWPSFQVVGLPDASIQEAKERIRTAWKNSGLTFPNNSRVVINLAPADVRKEGTGYDLPIAVAMFAASENTVPQEVLEKTLFVGELALDGALRAVPGVLPLVFFAKEQGYARVFIPEANQREAEIVSGVEVYAAPSFQAVIDHITQKKSLPRLPSFVGTLPLDPPSYEIDMRHVAGQAHAKRALEIAAAGGHNIILSGPPGSGKTMLARAFASILPSVSVSEAIEITKIYSVAGLLSVETPLITVRPFRSPHHSASGVSLVGGGSTPRPGEISLAHRGVLFLDEFPEFPRAVLEALRQPLEDGEVTIARAEHTLTFPARFALVASQNPCPCGYASDPERRCTCSPIQVVRYQKKISGPLLDRIDIFIEVPRVPFDTLTHRTEGESSIDIRLRVEAARVKQRERFRSEACVANSDMGSKDVRRYCELDETGQTILRKAVETLHLSPRSYYRILKVARTIADLALEERILSSHVAEALQYRPRTDTTI